MFILMQLDKSRMISIISLAPFLKASHSNPKIFGLLKSVLITASLPGDSLLTFYHIWIINRVRKLFEGIKLFSFIFVYH